MVNVKCTRCLHSKRQDLFKDKNGKPTQKCQPCRDQKNKNFYNRKLKKHIQDNPDDDMVNNKMCRKCIKVKPMDHFKNKKGETYKMCQQCRECEFPDDDILNKKLCTNCGKMIPMDRFKNKKGETCKMCLYCIEHKSAYQRKCWKSTEALNFGDKNIDLWDCKVCHDPYPHFEFVGSSKTCTLCTTDAKNLERELQCPHETCMYRGYKLALRRHVGYMHHAANAEIMIYPDCPYTTQKPQLFKQHRLYCTGDLNVSAGELAIMRVLNQYDIQYDYDTRYKVKSPSGAWLRWDIHIYHNAVPSTILSNLTGSNITCTPQCFMVISRMECLKGKKSTTK